MARLASIAARAGPTPFRYFTSESSVIWAGMELQWRMIGAEGRWPAPRRSETEGVLENSPTEPRLLAYRYQRSPGSRLRLKRRRSVLKACRSVGDEALDLFEQRRDNVSLGHAANGLPFAVNHPVAAPRGYAQICLTGFARAIHGATHHSQ